jgi:hypothetical protein
MWMILILKILRIFQVIKGYVYVYLKMTILVDICDFELIKQRKKKEKML